MSNGSIGLLDNFLTQAEAGTELRKDPRTLKRWQDRKIGPPITYVGRTPYYSVEALRRWIAGQERSVKPPEPPRRGRPRGKCADRLTSA
jgi:hypothetical protein